MDTKELQKIASQVRRDIVRMIHGVQSGHPGGSLGCADYITTLYFDVIKHNPENFTIDGMGEDMFFLSNGHIAPAWYSVLARIGYFPVSELSTLRKLGSRLQGHPSIAKGLPGIRVASGSLGQGLSVAIGVALSKKLNKDSNLVYVLMGDGEIQEGQIWEAALYASANKVDNIIAAIDYNKKQIDGAIKDVLDLGNLRAKWESFGWEVIELNGNNIDDIKEKISIAQSKIGKNKPVMLLMETEMGMGVDFMMGTHAWHGKAPNDDEAKIALNQLEETLGDY